MYLDHLKLQIDLDIDDSDYKYDYKVGICNVCGIECGDDICLTYVYELKIKTKSLHLRMSRSSIRLLYSII
mgnify:CR=1 FL=1